MAFTKPVVEAIKVLEELLSWEQQNAPQGQRYISSEGTIDAIYAALDLLRRA